MATAVVIGWLSVVIGLTVSYHADTAASASVAGAAVAIFFVVLAVTELARLVGRRRAPLATV
jgi:manganese/iron transport system permease protein